MKRHNHDPQNGFGKWGGYMEAKITKLEEQFAENANQNIYKRSNLFNGISIYVNGYTKPSADELKRIMMANGGTFHHYQRSHTKFIIASNLPDVKIRANTDKIIRADWVVDCLKQNKILDYSNYLIYTHQKTEQPKITFSDKNSKASENLKSKNGACKTKCSKNDKTKIVQSDWTVILKELEILNEKMQTTTRVPSTDLKDEANKTYLNIPSSSESENTNVPINNYSPNIFESDQEHYEDYIFEKNKRTTPIIQISSESSGPESIIQLKEHDTEIINLIESSDSNNVKLDKIEQNDKVTLKSKSARTAVDPKFLSEFYNNSRLHHISILGAAFKQHINELRQKHSGHFPARDKILHLEKDDEEIDINSAACSISRTVMHIDIDCFFVSVGLKTRPHLIGQPVAVTHSKGSNGGTIMSRPGVNRQAEIEISKKKLREKFKTKTDDELPEIQKFYETVDDDKLSSMSEIASCNYEAREKGVKNGMFVGTALKLCPNLKTIPYDFTGYKEVAETLYNTVSEYTLDIEAVSCDEMFVDLTKLLQETKINCLKFVSFLRDEIKLKTDCNCSAGIGENRLQARLATKKAKPNGQFFLRAESVEEFMRSIKITDLPGVGHTTEQRMSRFNWKLCGDLQKLSMNFLQTEFGKKFGTNLYQFSRGIDNRPLVFDQVRKSVSAEVNYGIRFTTNNEVEIFLEQLCTEVHNRLVEIKKKGKCIILKLMIRDKDAQIETSKFLGHGICENITKSILLPNYTTDLDLIIKTVLSIMKSITVLPSDLRGIGIQITKLDDSIKNNSNKLKQMFSKTIQRNQQNKLCVEQNQEEKPFEKIIVERANQFTTINKTETKTTSKNERGKGKKANTATSTTKSIANMFQNGQLNTKQQQIFNNLDLYVLNELPPDIRDEVMNDNRLKLLNAQTSINKCTITKPDCNLDNKIQVNAEFLDALPIDLRLEIEKEIAAQDGRLIEDDEIIQIESKSDENIKCDDNADNILLKPDWKEILQAWINSTTTPEDCDIKIICNYFNELITNRKWEEIYLKLRYFIRIVEEQTICEWHKACVNMLIFVQTNMMNIHQKKLHITTNFKCC